VIAKRGLARNWKRVVISFLRMKEQLWIEEKAVSEIGERYGTLRIVSPRADAAMVKSIRNYGQMTPVVCVKREDGYELIDGFKRLRACRRLDQTTLRVKTIEVSARVCKAAIIQFNRSGRSISEMEEALVIQSLHREDGLTQTEIGVLLGRDKSWVSRRISLIERLSEEVQEDLRLGLISVITDRELSKLPRGNQKEAADAILKRSGDGEVDRVSLESSGLGVFGDSGQSMGGGGAERAQAQGVGGETPIALRDLPNRFGGG
jgi:ParB/RepB/Spo0J family partition protein